MLGDAAFIQGEQVEKLKHFILYMLYSGLDKVSGTSYVI